MARVLGVEPKGAVHKRKASESWGTVSQAPCILEGICLSAEDSEVNGMSHSNAEDRTYQEGTGLVHCSVKRPVTLPLRVLPLKKLVQREFRAEKSWSKGRRTYRLGSDNQESLQS